MTQPTPDVRAVVRALALLTTQVKRIADHTAPPVVTGTDDAPTTDEDALRTARRDSLLVLLSHAAHGTLIPEEGDLLRQHVEDEIRESNTARAVAAGNLRHVQVMYAELTTAQAAIERARKLATRWAVLRAYGSAATELRAALALDYSGAEPAELVHPDTEQQASSPDQVDEHDLASTEQPTTEA